MTARTPEDVDRQFAEALNAGSLDALVALYEPQAALTPMPDKLVTGTAAIREALAGFLAGKPHITLTPRLVAQTGDVAGGSAKWEVSVTGRDGEPGQTKGESVEGVGRRSHGGGSVAMGVALG